MRIILSLFLAHVAVTSNAFVTPRTTGFVSRKVSFVRSRVLFSETPGAATEISDATENAVVEVPAAEEAVAEEPAAEVAAAEESPAEETEGEVADVVAEADESADDESEPAAPAPSNEPPKHTMYIGNLPFATTEDDLTEMFGAYGTVEVVKIPLDKFTGQSRGFGFVSMSTKEEMDSAIEGLNGSLVNERTIRVSESEKFDKTKKRERAPQGKKLYVGNLSFDADEEDLKVLYADYNVQTIYIPRHPDTGNSRGYAFITLDPELADEALEATNGLEFMGRDLNVDLPLPRGEKAERLPRQDYSNGVKLYVGNLSFYTTVEEIRELFEEYGAVEDCYMPMDRYTGRARGFAFVTMPPEAAKKAAEETDGLEMDGRVIRVNEAQPKGYSGAAQQYNDQDSDNFGDNDSYDVETGFDDSE